jgi:hypothetical protein
MRGYCVACDKRLVGKQRLFCSDACRKRYKRLSAQYPTLTENRPVSDLIARESSVLIRDGPGIAVIMVIGYNHHGKTHESDGWAIKSQFGKELQKVALETLKRLFYDWEFKIIKCDVQKK